MKKIQILKTVGESFGLALKNIPSFVGCIILWALTIWIPYINIGTTIALLTMPIELSKGNAINPFSIFASKYRKKMGDFFIYNAISGFALLICSLFMIIPGMVLSIAWSMGLYIMIENDKNPLEALKLSNNVTYGNKWRIWFSKLFVSGILMIVFSFILYYLAENTSFTIGSVCIITLMVIVIICCSLAVNAVVWKNLKQSDELLK